MAAAGLAACGGSGGGGGGGGGGSGATFSISTHALSFSASGPAVATPPSQTVSATVTGTLSGTLYIVVSVAGSAVQTVSNFSVSGNSGQGSVSVTPPSALGIGTFSSTLTIRACVNDSTCSTGELNGSPQTVNVSYTINGPAIADSAMPHVITSGKSGSLVLRGGGFTGTASVAFGSIPATSFTVVNDSLIQVTYPATLTAGLQAIVLTGAQKPFSGQVVAVGPQVFPAADLTYPSAPQRIAAVVFDGQREVLYVAAVFSSASANQIWAYTYANGTWSAPQVIAIAGLTDLALSADGSRLYALTQTSVQELDATNPGGSAPVTVQAPFALALVGNPYLVHFALANDGNAVVETGLFGVQGAGDTYLFSTASGTFSDLGGMTQLANNPDGTASSLGASADGSLVIAAQQRAVGSSPPAFSYNPVSGLVSVYALPLSQLFDEPPALNTSGTKAVFTDGNYSFVQGGSNDILGYLTSTATRIRVDLINPQGTRAYELRDDATLHTFDLTATPVGSPITYPEIGTPVPQQIPRTSSQTLRTAITPDGSTLFIAGDAGVAVIPAPH